MYIIKIIKLNVYEISKLINNLLNYTELNIN